MAQPPAELGNPEAFLIPREGDRDLAFTGWLLSKKTHPTRVYNETTNEGRAVDAGIDLCIYATEAGRIVTHSLRWTEYARHESGERFREGTVKATWHVDAEAALAWLRDDSGGRLGDLSKTVWTEACRRWPELSMHEFEAVDAMKVSEY